MLKTILGSLLLLMISCGVQEKPIEVRPGPQGEDGADGKPGEPGEPGKPADPSDANLVLSHAVCATSAQTSPTSDGYPKFELSYEITVFSDETAWVSLVEKHYFRAGSNPNVESNALFYVKDHPNYNTAPIESTMWEAKLKNNVEVTFSYKPGSFSRSVTCK